ncbi:aminotransferase-like domain-containing protein [Streptomyces pinistramenti]|uniref:aminotransferase-like domain-containing protein n=1 Tax=Streptomyces pinistramenti TaxID=2884812 RepID=UPI001D080E84|nr:PLP-dependent aminotransferase family protein [Streptomyces pinistramenti]MCB5910655.1 PLP-dependent aminotransferase family protein [Streptomyces pinistramenti]
MTAEEYQRIADTVAAAIAAGRLRPGDRLPTQRAFARTHRIAPSTATRVYRELARRGLTVGEVGRGTFVRAAQHPTGPALAEPAADGGGHVNLELNYPAVPEQSALLADGLAPLLRPDTLAAALRPSAPSGTAAARNAAAGLLTGPGLRPDPDQLLFPGNGRQALAGALATLVPPGARLGVEALTYPMIKGIAARLGITLVPLATDEQGLCPDALRAAHRTAPLRAVYVQPTLHNPLGTTMPATRRAELADALEALDVWAVEDTVWAFLCGAPPGGRAASRSPAPPPPLASYAPGRTILVDSLSKRLAPGLTVGLALAPPSHTGRLAAALRSGGWTATGFALEAATRWMTDGSLERIVAAKRRDAAARQALAAELLDGQEVHADPRAYFLWWQLPSRWRAETFLAAAARRGIAVTPAAAFAVAAEGTQGAGPAPNAVRIALAGATFDQLSRALPALASIARGAPDDTLPE